jgi:hypothetical protein
MAGAKVATIFTNFPPGFLCRYRRGKGRRLAIGREIDSVLVASLFVAGYHRCLFYCHLRLPCQRLGRARQLGRFRPTLEAGVRFGQLPYFLLLDEPLGKGFGKHRVRDGE